MISRHDFPSSRSRVLYSIYSTHTRRSAMRPVCVAVGPKGHRPKPVDSPLTDPPWPVGLGCVADTDMTPDNKPTSVKTTHSRLPRHLRGNYVVEAELEFPVWKLRALRDKPTVNVSNLLPGAFVVEKARARAGASANANATVKGVGWGPESKRHGRAPTSRMAAAKAGLLKYCSFREATLSCRRTLAAE